MNDALHHQSGALGWVSGSPLGGQLNPGIDQQAHLQAMAQQAAFEQAVRQHNSAYANAVRPQNPDERLLVLLTED